MVTVLKLHFFREGGRNLMELSMHHRTLDEITQVATIFPAGKPPSSEVRRERLRRLATVLDEHVGPIQLLSEIEYLSRSDFSTARCDCSPLALAFEDYVLRRQGADQ